LNTTTLCRHLNTSTLYRTLNTTTLCRPLNTIMLNSLLNAFLLNLFHFCGHSPLTNRHYNFPKQQTYINRLKDNSLLRT
jgi:hypothetical protein